ncbi:jg10874 [Pararge aegeria aegeria]|uniref:Jg10874 protein n=1 Tax=Pararge aegeria aegeria TaxID=348720 RepID=A0A8S4RBT8_9NEOP|nr:jg10874 [Pararge aegeria aegeria]
MQRSCARASPRGARASRAPLGSGTRSNPIKTSQKRQSARRGEATRQAPGSAPPSARRHNPPPPLFFCVFIVF